MSSKTMIQSDCAIAGVQHIDLRCRQAIEFEKLDQERRQKSKTQYLIVADQVVNDGNGQMLVSVSNATAKVLRNKSEIKRLRAKGQSLRHIAFESDWYFLEDVLD